MAKLTFLSENFVDDSVLTLLTGTADAQFPLENVKDMRTTKVFRSDDNTVEIQVDLGLTQTIDSFAITGSSTDGLGFTALTIYGSGSTDFSGSTPITIDLNSENAFGFKLFTGVAFRFWKLEFTGTGSYTEVSNFFLGAKTQFTENSFSQNSFRYLNADNSRIRNNSYGQPFIDKRSRLKRISGTMQHMNATEFDTVDELFIRHGKTEPIWIITDPDGLSATDAEFKFSAYARFLAVREVRVSAYRLYTMQLTLKEIG